MERTANQELVNWKNKKLFMAIILHYRKQDWLTNVPLYLAREWIKEI